MTNEYKYKKALERCKEILNDEEEHSIQEIVEYTSPELAESKDVKIRKEIKQFIRSRGMSLAQSKVDSWIAWLEKQGEHARFIEAIQVGDKVTRNEDGILVNLSQLNRVAKKDEKQGERKPAEWSEDDQSNFCELSSFIFETYRAEDASRLITWLKSIKDRVQPQPKQEWSEDDEEMVQVAINACNSYQDSLVRNDSRFDKAVKAEGWLKSLRPQYHWKPSEEQMENLSRACNGGTYRTSLLMDLYQDLKKLKG